MKCKNNTGLFLLFSAVALLCTFNLSSCKKFVEIDPPSNVILSPSVFSDSATANSAILGNYIFMMNRGLTRSLFFGDGGITLYTGLTSDELYSNTGLEAETEFYTNNITPINITNFNNIWNTGFKIIYNANACLEGLNASTGINPTAKRQMEGEVKFLRAFAYFHLVNLYGDVPLMTSTSFRSNGTLVRTSKDNVYNQIVQDLKDAESLMKGAYFTTGRMRPINLVASAMLAKVYLFQKKWAEAEAASTTVISSPLYALETDFSKIFLNTSKEAIFQLAPTITGNQTTEGINFIGSNSPTAPPFYSITDTLFKSFRSDDLRRNNWIQPNIRGGVTYYSPYKYKLGYTGGSVTEPYMVLRLGEQYLIRAEARAQLDKFTDGKDDLNKIRTRAGLPNTLANNSTELIDSVLNERKLELFVEWGNRWYDLKRTNKIDQTLSGIKPSWKSTAALYPIPADERSANPQITQNSGYAQ